ncbi:MAG TPA: histidine phosphatase family protein [Polyangiaceae bacterium]|nr:histidine phosphatase family protein [Polyangiaceae bacterium]
MRTFIIFRHAKAVQEGASSDRERELTDKGRKAARAMGRLAREQDQVPDAVLCSTATRARETFALFAEGCHYEGRVEFIDELYLAPPAAYVEAARRLGRDAERLMVVGHNPGLEGLLDELTASSESLPTAALAVCELPIETWDAMGGKRKGLLKALWRPKEL